MKPLDHPCTRRFRNKYKVSTDRSCFLCGGSYQLQNQHFYSDQDLLPVLVVSLLTAVKTKLMASWQEILAEVRALCCNFMIMTLNFPIPLLSSQPIYNPNPNIKFVTLFCNRDIIVLQEKSLYSNISFMFSRRVLTVR